MQRANSLEKTLMLRKIEGKRRRGRQRMRWFDSIINLMDMNLSKLQEIVEDRGNWHAAVFGVPKSQTSLSDWTTTSVVNQIMYQTMLSIWITIFFSKKQQYNSSKHQTHLSPVSPLVSALILSFHPGTWRSYMHSFCMNLLLNDLSVHYIVPSFLTIH